MWYIEGMTLKMGICGMFVAMISLNCLSFAGGFGQSAIKSALGGSSQGEDQGRNCPPGTQATTRYENVKFENIKLKDPCNGQSMVTCLKNGGPNRN